MSPTDSAEYKIFKIYDGEVRSADGRQGREIARVTASTYKYGPSNAIRVFVMEKHPPAGRYLVAGPGAIYNSALGRYDESFSIYEVAYPEYAISPGRSHDGWDLIGEREVTE